MLVKLVSSLAIPFLKGFKPSGSGLYQLNKTARNLDRTFLNELSVADWKQLIEEIQTQLSDSVIALAMNKFPAEIAESSKDKIGSRFRNRRDGLLPAALKYYKQLAKNAYVFGSEKIEFFEVKNINNDVQVTVYANIPDKDSAILYQRVFTPNETRQIYLVSVRGDDKLVLPAAKTKIRIRVIKPVNDEKYDLRKKMLKRLRDKGQA